MLWISEPLSVAFSCCHSVRLGQQASLDVSAMSVTPSGCANDGTYALASWLSRKVKTKEFREINHQMLHASDTVCAR